MLTMKFKFPKSLADGSVTVRELSVQEGLDIATAYGTQPAQRMEESAKRSVVECLGTKWTADNRDAAWAACSAKMRDLIMGAYGRTNLADDKEREDFFGSAEVTV